MRVIKYSRWVQNYIKTVIVVPIALAIAFYTFDPMMLFHKPFDRDVTTATANMRLQAAGIINSLDYNSYILGTSMLENTSANSASDLIGGKFANISLNGSDYFERSYALTYALKNGAKNIVYSIGPYYLNQRKGDPRFSIDSFSYLYSDNILKVRFYLQPKYIRCLLTWSESVKCIGMNQSLDRPNSWSGHQDYDSRFGGLQNWFSAENNDEIIEVFTSISASAKRVKKGEYDLVNKADLNLKINNAIQYIDDYLISFVRENPTTKFYFIFPPLSRIKYAQWHQLSGTDAKVHEAVVRYFAKIATELKNLTVYGYEDQKFLDDIGNYRDTGHYNEWVNKKMLIDIANNEHTLSSGTVDTYLEIARKKALGFDLIGLGNEIDDHLNRSSEK